MLCSPYRLYAACEWFTPRLSVISQSAHCDGGAAWWQTAASVLFILMLINAYILKFRKGGTHSHTHEVESITTQKFKVTGMRCNHCKANVEKAIAALPNVTSLSIELSDGTVEVEGNVSAEDVCGVVQQLGFEIEVSEL